MNSRMTAPILLLLLAFPEASRAEDRPQEPPMIAVLGDSLATGAATHPSLTFDAQDLWRVFSGVTPLIVEGESGGEPDSNHHKNAAHKAAQCTLCSGFGAGDAQKPFSGWLNLSDEEHPNDKNKEVYDVPSW